MGGLRRFARAVTLLAPLAAAIAPPAAAADPPQVALVAGGGALGTFDLVTDGGCLHTFGEVAVVEAQVGGELADGLYVTGMQENTCTGAGNGFAGFTEGNSAVLGLVFASVTATLVAPSYSGGPPVTLEVDLRWLGRGRVTRDGGVFQDGDHISFSFTRRRSALTFGDLVIDGAPAEISMPTLVSETSGQITF